MSSRLDVESPEAGSRQWLVQGRGGGRRSEIEVIERVAGERCSRSCQMVEGELSVLCVSLGFCGRLQNLQAGTADCIRLCWRVMAVFDTHLLEV